MIHRLDLPRPLPRFRGGCSDVNGTEEEIGIGERGTAKVPSGLYFLGLPLFFFSSEEAFSGGIVKLNGGAAFSVTAAAADVVVGGTENGLGLSGRGGGSIE